MEEKRIYSLNLIAYITYKTQMKPQIKIDENGLYYALFPEVRAVAFAIREFRQDGCIVELHNFLAEYKSLRLQINAMRGE